MKSVISKINIQILFQILPIELLFTIFWNSALLSDYSDKSNILIVILGTILLNVMLIITLYAIIIVHRPKINIYFFIKNNLGFFIILSISLLCYLTVINAWLNLDGYLYYSDIRKIKEWDFSNISKLMLAGHSSHGLTSSVMIGEFLFPNNILGVRIIQFVLYAITTYCFYKTIKHTLKKINEPEAFLYTAVFALSPMFLGLSAEINTDFPLLCFFVWMFYCGIKGYYLLQAFCALLLCFSKETGCLLYGFYLFGILLGNLITWRRQNLPIKVKYLFSCETILMISSGCIWIANFLFGKGIGWMNTIASSPQTAKTVNTGIKLNSLGFFPKYIFEKVQQMLFINFNWILYALILFLICDMVIEKHNYKESKVTIKQGHIFALLLSFIAFLLYNFFYITYNHYRYLIPFSFFICFTAMLTVHITIKKRMIKLFITSGITILFVLSNFFTIDPISQSLFLKEGTGLGNILIPCTIITDSNNNAVIKDKESYESVIINTSGIYNFQYAYLGQCFDKTLEEINYDEEILLIMPMEYRDDWGTRASIFGINLAGIDDIYWDTEKKQTNINCAEQISDMEQDKKYQKINLCITNDMKSVNKKMRNKYKKIYYIALPFQQTFNHFSFLSNEKIKFQKTIQYISWKWVIHQIK